MDTNFGKVPPQNLEAETIVLGSCLIEQGAYHRVADILEVNMFYKDAHQIIYQALCNLDGRSEPIDLVTVHAELKRMGELETVGGMYYVDQLSDRIGTTAHLEEHAKLVEEAFIRRDIIQHCHKMITAAFEDTEDTDQLISDFQNRAVRVNRSSVTDVRHISDTIGHTMALIDKNAKSESKITGIPSGLRELDSHTLGFQRGDLIIIGGEPSNGKTSLALTCCRFSALNGHATGFITYEMTDIQLASRLISIDSDIPSKRILMDKLHTGDIQQIHGSIGKLTDSPLYTVTPRSTSFKSLVSMIRMLVMKFKVEQIFVDYIQLIRNHLRGKSTADEVAEVANVLKNLATTLNVNIIALSQLSRDPNPVPNLKRLKNSGDIEAAADVVIFVHRPEHYGTDVFTFSGNDKEYNSENLMVVDVAKGRNIGLKKMLVEFIKDRTYCRDYDYMRFVDGGEQKEDLPF